MCPIYLARSKFYDFEFSWKHICEIEIDNFQEKPLMCDRLKTTLMNEVVS